MASSRRQYPERFSYDDIRDAMVEIWRRSTASPPAATTAARFTRRAT
ncbi:hypothetical protein [Streptomyces sp. NPDC054804]